ncbi:MAG: LLM class flavin-dependent oxidoreductase [Rubrobacter sp.]|nr:LLM class flavin-dependent oxidoreductase [Rubrobacter sp.]
MEFGPLVSPVSFRHPVITAWTAAAVNDLSGGCLWLGLGAGWQEREHQTYGFELLGTDRRFARLEEGLEVITRLLCSEEPISFEGEFYQLRDAVLMPHPPAMGGPPIIIGGNGLNRTLPLAAHYADEWNAIAVSAPQFARLSARLDELLWAAGRSPGQVRRRLMTRVVFGRTTAEVERKLDGVPREWLYARGVIVGTANEIVDQLGALTETGVLQWLEVDDVDRLVAFARSVLPQL